MRISRLPVSVLAVASCLTFSGERLLAQNKDKEPIAPSVERYADGLKKWSPYVSVAVRYFSDDGIQVSPDGKHFFFVSWRGELGCDCNLWELSVYDTASVLAALREPSSHAVKPLRTLMRRAGTLNRKIEIQHVRGIVQPQWMPDAASISFEGVDEQGIPQLYLYEVSSGTVSAITQWKDNVERMRYSQGMVIATLRKPNESGEPPPVYPVHAITTESVLRMLGLLDGALNTRPSSREAYFVSSRESKPWELNGVSADLATPSPSADGRRAIALLIPEKRQPQWSGYEQYETYFRGVSAFNLLDMKRQRFQPVFDAPMGLVTKAGMAAMRKIGYTALWAHDQRNAVLINTALPLTPGRNPERARMSYIVNYDADTGEWSVIEPIQSRTADGAVREVSRIGWLTPGKELLIQHEIDGKPAAGTVYTLKGNRWTGRTVAATVHLQHDWWESPAPALADGLSIRLKQNDNTPQVIVASNGQREIPLTEADPVLDGVWRARQEPFEWTLPDGKKLKAGLLLPRDSRTPLPLVIQLYTYDPDEFRPDGPSKHAYAGQSLLARGMAVLNLDLPEDNTPNSSYQRPPVAERVETVIEALSAKGLIDRARVGLIGFSNAGYNGYYIITHPGKTPLAAVVMDDSFTGTFTEELAYAAEGSEGNLYRIYGGTFWQKKAHWLEQDSLFNVDRVQTPALFTLHHEAQILYSETLSTIGAFAQTRRPLEYLVFPYGSHGLSMPRQRVASQQASLEWMAFWLQDAVPAGGERAGRWSTIKANWNRQKAWEAAGHPVGSVPGAGFTARDSK